MVTGLKSEVTGPEGDVISLNIQLKDERNKAQKASFKVDHLEKELKQLQTTSASTI